MRGLFAIVGLVVSSIMLPAQAAGLDGSQVREIKRQSRLILAERAAKEGDVLLWGKMLMPDKFKLNFCEPLHGHLANVRKETFVSIEAPRGHAKTTVGCVLIPLFQGLVEPQAFRHYLNIQANAEKSLAVNRAIKVEIEQNEGIKELYGDQVGKDRWTDAVFVLKNGVAFSADGAGASIRGINYRSVRPDYVICDDLYDTDQDANSPTSTEKKNSWFWSTLFPALAQDKVTSMHFQGTAVNRYDLFEKLKMDETVRSKTFKAITDWDKKEVLWKGLKTFEEFERMRTRMGTLIFSREFQNERRDDSSSVVKRSWLYPDDGGKNWEYDPTSLRFGEFCTLQACVVTLDPSIGKKVHNDKSGYAIVLKVQRPGGILPEYYVEAVINAHHSFQQRIDTVKELVANRPADQIATKARVETIAGFKDIGDRIAASISIPCDLVDHVPDKITNLEKKSAVFENHRIFLNRDIDPALKEELTYQITTNNPKHDDLRDAVLLGIDDDNTSDWSSWV